MWAEYASASLASSIAPLHFDAFHKVRRRERVGIRFGDIFINRDEVELAEILAQIESGKALAEDWQERIVELERNLSFCKERKLYYREAHQNLKDNSKKMIVTLDFTATQTGMQDKFHDFVVVVCTDQRLSIPLDLANAVIEPVEPPMKKKVAKPVLEKKKRKTKEEVKSLGGGRNLLPSFNQSNAKVKRQPRLEQRVVDNIIYKPCSTVFHFVLKRTDSTPGQISSYVQWAMNFLFVRHDLGQSSEEIHLFSDGCGKHFKTYPTHWYDSFRSFVCFLFLSICLYSSCLFHSLRYLADLQQRLLEKKRRANNNNSNLRVEPHLRIHWDYLPPGDAHNRCDGAAAHWKRPQKKLIRDFAVLTTVGHLAFACASLKNCYLIEAECAFFPDPLEVLIEEPWMREAFHFDYGVPFADTKYCAHQNKLNYACCKKEPKHLPCVTILTANRDYQYIPYLLTFFSHSILISIIFILMIRLSQHILWLDEEQKRDDELDSLEENDFWDSPSRRRYYSISGPRISQLSAESRKIYEYENNDDDFVDSGDDEDSDDDFLGS
jgi:hypothetical protein